MWGGKLSRLLDISNCAHALANSPNRIVHLQHILYLEAWCQDYWEPLEWFLGPLCFWPSEFRWCPSAQWAQSPEERGKKIITCSCEPTGRKLNRAYVRIVKRLSTFNKDDRSCWAADDNSEIALWKPLTHISSLVSLSLSEPKFKVVKPSSSSCIFSSCSWHFFRMIFNFALERVLKACFFTAMYTLQVKVALIWFSVHKYDSDLFFSPMTVWKAQITWNLNFTILMCATFIGVLCMCNRS